MEIIIVKAKEAWEYRCQDCKQFRLDLRGKEPKTCGNCGSANLINIKKIDVEK